MATGYFKLYRPLQDHWIYKDSRYLHLWLECLINSRWSEESKTDVYKGVMYKIERGQFLFSRTTYAERLKIDEATIRRCINLMIKDGMIFKVCSLGKNKPTIYEVANFDKYNPLAEPNEYVENTCCESNLSQVVTKSKPSDDQVVATKEESNKSNNDNKKEKNSASTDALNTFFETHWKMYPNKKGKGQIKPKAKKETLRLGDEFKRCIDRYVESVNKRRVEGFKDLQYQNGSTFWNSGYVDYLDENYKGGEEIGTSEREQFFKSLEARHM